jgi:hypothetical protein
MHSIICVAFRKPEDSAVLTAALSEFWWCLEHDAWEYYARDFHMSPRMSLLYASLHRGVDFRR